MVLSSYYLYNNCILYSIYDDSFRNSLFERIKSYRRLFHKLLFFNIFFQYDYFYFLKGKRIDDIEGSISDLMGDLGVDEQELH